VEQSLLADAHVEGMAAEGKGAGIAANHRHLRRQSDVARQPRRGRHPPGVDFHARHPAPAPAREKPRGPAEPGADVQHATVRVNTAAAREDVDGRDPAVVILIEFEEVVGLELAESGVTARGRAYVRLVDRMPVVEVDGDRV